MAVEHFDVIVVGAGLSGIGAASHLQTNCPGRRYVILEGREAIGGTWNLFRYPGVRSDSDMFTLAYSFRPWAGDKSIADGASILQYVRDTAEELGIDQHIRFNQRVCAATWSSAESRWTVVVDAATQYTCSFLYVCSGYYQYDQGFSPAFAGRERFRGQVVHPQHWPDSLDYTGLRVVVIGSGATAVSLVPAMAEKAAHVTMLQRSPTYIASISRTDGVAAFLRKVLPASVAQPLVRAKNVMMAMVFFEFCKRFPSLARRVNKWAVSKALPADYDVETHFTPRYNPWEQRFCFVPDNDLFNALKSGRVSIETDRIDTFTEEGIRLESGKTLEADLIATATGLELLAFGGISLSVDDVTVQPGQTYTYKGVMLGEVPNFAFCLGYTNASWTLRADLSSAFVCRVLNKLSDGGYAVAKPRLDASQLTPMPLHDLTSGYVQRALGHFPQQGAKSPRRRRRNRRPRRGQRGRGACIGSGPMQVVGRQGPQARGVKVVASVVTATSSGTHAFALTAPFRRRAPCEKARSTAPSPTKGR